MKDRDQFNENARIRKFTDENVKMFYGELNNESNTESYEQIFDKYDKRYRDFADKFNSEKRNLSKIDPNAFELHFKAVEVEHPTLPKKLINFDKSPFNQ